MTSEELKAELKKQKEKECYADMVLEYIRVKSLVGESGALTHDEVCAIALEICKRSGTFGWQ